MSEDHSQNDAGRPVSIRRYAACDWEAISIIHDRARLVELELTVGTGAFRPLAVTASEEGLFDGSLWVAETESKIAGFIVLQGDEITWLYVSPSYARLGIGRSLLRHAIACCEGPVDVCVLAGNQPALALYHAEGFEIVETREGHLQGLEDVPARGHILRRLDRG